jgi:hypothetical protein
VTTLIEAPLNPPAPSFEGFAFEPEGHVYTLHGDPIHGVTSVLTAQGILPDYSGIDPFYAARGAAVHTAIELDLEDTLDIETLDPQLLPFMDRWWEIRDRLGIEPIWSEVMLCDPTRRYAGRLDLLCRITGSDDLWLLDWKTGDFHPGHFIQVAGGYAPIVSKALDGATVRVGVVSLANKNPKLETASADDLATSPAVFRAALCVQQWRGVKGCNR